MNKFYFSSVNKIGTFYAMYKLRYKYNVFTRKTNKDRYDNDDDVYAHTLYVYVFVRL